MPVTQKSHNVQLVAALNAALVVANQVGVQSQLPPETRGLVRTFSSLVGSQATSAFTNIITCLAAAAADPTCDPRYHRPNEGTMPAPPIGKTYFTGRSISEIIVYPWLAEHEFRGAMSGWQTRVFERERPYLLDYPENIARVKAEFLAILDSVANGRVAAHHVLIEFFRLEIIESQRRSTAVLSVADAGRTSGMTIDCMVRILETHFAMPRSARLPVLALYATLQVLLPTVDRYKGHRLRPMSEHSAADANTGAAGDIEIEDEFGNCVEAVEIKHGVSIDDNIIRRICEKVSASHVSRYYVLSTLEPNQVTLDGRRKMKAALDGNGCQIIINGVLPTIKYYLRLALDPSQFLEKYGNLLATDRRVISAELEEWRRLIASCDPPANDALM